jgi:hypothetical protein
MKRKNNARAIYPSSPSLSALSLWDEFSKLSKKNQKQSKKTPYFAGGAADPVVGRPTATLNAS